MSAIVVLPEVTRKRMLILQNLLQNWQSEKITSVQISEITGWKDSLIRHDLWLLGYNKGISNGYLKDDLQQAISLALGFESKEVNCCIVGLNRLGAALLDDATTEGSVFKIKAGFDSNVNRVEILRSTFPLYPATEMNWVIKKENIRLAILTVADKDAQSMCDRLVKAGVTGIVNMTGRILKVPDGIKVENVSVITALKMVN
ncbi:MAG: CoA-binding protein [Spirochaetales bacterium]|nr:CoA-binding protein [Spirochaetales bacterium]